MNDIKIFSNTEFGELSIMIIGDKEYFPATQCARLLVYKNPQKVNYITEGDLYRLIVSSKLPTADKFKRWVFDTVLPTICKTGGYVNNDELFINTYLSYADENTKNLFRLQLNTITQLNTKIEQNKPLVDFAKQISSTTDLIDIGALSKLLRKHGLNIGMNKLFEWLRDNKFLRPNNEPYQQYINQGYFKTKESTYFVGSEPKITIKTFVTGKDQQYIFDKLSSATIEQEDFEDE